MKRWLKILIAIFIVIVLLIAGLAIWQWDNIKAAYTAFTSDAETITTQMETKRQEQEQAMSEFNVTVQALDAVQTGNLLDGKVSAEEVKASLGITQEMLDQAKAETEVQPEKKPAKKNKKSSKPKVDVKSAQEKANDLMNKCAAELYACEVDLMAKLGEMKQSALAKWFIIPPEDRTDDKLISIGLTGLEQCYDLEVSADKQVRGILARYRTQLESLGVATTALDDIWKYYCEKKANQKAYYLNKYIN